MFHYISPFSDTIKRNVTENCIIIDSINVFEGKSIMDVIKLEETVENLKKG